MTTSCDPDPAVPKRQFRAMWIASVANIDWPSRASRTAPSRIAVQQAEFQGWLDLAQRHNHNAVIVQIRPTADAFWPSPHEPWSGYLTGVAGRDPGWDPLDYLVAATHARGLEFHAWFNPYRVSMPGEVGSDIGRLPSGHPVRDHPDWAIACPVGVAGSRLYYDPGNPAVREFVQLAIMDAVTRYDIDAVHFDDYFYPYPVAGQDFADQASFVRYGAGYASRAAWRRDNIDRLVREMGTRIKAAKPWVKFGVSPFGIWRNRAADPLGSRTNGLQSYDANHADTRSWVRREWVDYIVPQLYWHIGFGVADYAELVAWWSRVVSGTRVQLYIGQADYKIGDPAQPAPWQDPTELARHLRLNRTHPEVRGNVHFSAIQVRANRLGAVERYVGEHYSRPALAPTMPHLALGPLAPVLLDAARDASGVRLSWRQPAGPGTGATAYVVYRFEGPADRHGCDPLDPRHLIAIAPAHAGDTHSHLDRSAVPGVGYSYQVSALDRLREESAPSPPRFLG